MIDATCRDGVREESSANNSLASRSIDRNRHFEGRVSTSIISQEFTEAELPFCSVIVVEAQASDIVIYMIVEYGDSSEEWEQ